MTTDFSRLNGINKGLRVGLPYSLQGWFDIRTGDDGIDHLIRLVGVRSLDDRDGGTVMAGVMDHITDLLGVFGDDKQGLLLVTAIGSVQCLCRDILEDDGGRNIPQSKE